MKKEFTNKLAMLMEKEGMDAVLVCPSEELTFLIGFSPAMCKRFQGLFIKKDGTCFYVCNLIYTTELEDTIKGMKIYSWFDGEVMAEGVHKFLQAEGLVGKTIGVNFSVPAFNILDIAERSNIKFKNAKLLIEEMRVIKTDEELENLRISASIVDKVFTQLIGFIKPGMTEAEIKGFMLDQMQKHGGTKPWAIVARGPNSSYPHYCSTDGVVEKQDVILFDFGCVYGNMFSDMSRMIFVGGITDEQRKVFETCQKATKAGEDACFEGAFIPDIDKAARDVVEAAGYGEYFYTRLGHGIGYMVHESPDIKASNPRKLEKGMSFTIEPGINVPGKFGMRIEDVVAITKNGVEILTKSTHELVVI